MSEAPAVGAPSGLMRVTEGEWAGWSTWRDDAFEERAGPFYERELEDGSVLCAFRAVHVARLGAGFMHGGCLMTFADSAIFTIARKAMGGSHGVTLHLAGDFLDPAREGQLIEARGEVVRAGGKTVFVQGKVTADGTPVLRFDANIRKVSGKRD